MKQSEKARPRPQLDAETIIEAALRLAATDREPITVRRLGKELGADPTAIYRHFRDKDELLREVLDHLIGQAVSAVDETAPWRTRITQLARISLDAMCAHPAIGALAASQTTGGQGEAAAIGCMLEAMVEAGLDREDSVRFYAVLSSYMVSFASAQAGSRVGTVAGTDEDPRWIGHSPALHRSRNPAILAVRDELETLRDYDIYDSGIQVILDAVTARVAAG